MSSFSHLLFSTFKILLYMGSPSELLVELILLYICEDLKTLSSVFFCL